MNTRSRLDEIEDVDFVVDKMVYKGLSNEEINKLLQKKSLSIEEANILIAKIEYQFQGIRRIERSKIVRFLSACIDAIFCFFIIFLAADLLTEPAFRIVLGFIPIVCFILPESIFGQTLGKFVTHSMVVNKKGVIPAFHLILVRTLCRLVPYDGIYYLMNDRTLHDRIPNTYVVNKKFWKQKYRFDEILHDK